VSLLRRPFVAGQFYKANVEALRLQIESCFLSNLGPRKLPNTIFPVSSKSRRVVGLICPHAGYLYSGAVAAWGFFELAQESPPKTVVLLGPNHTGYGGGLSLMREGCWQTPLGSVQVDTIVADAILSKLDYIDVGVSAHRFEHSLEVQLPFLQYLYGDNFKFVPLCFLMQDYPSAIKVGNALIEVLAAHDDAVVIASSDFSHYEPALQAEKKDLSALNAITALDASCFYETLEAQQITACGYAPIAALITYAKGLNAQARLLSYHHSGEVSGDYSSVVGYASVLFKK